MLRPRRSAAERARALIARGYSVRHVDECNTEGLSPEEEDELDRQLKCAEIGVEADDEDVEDTPLNACTSKGHSPKTYMSYDDMDENVDIPDFKPKKAVGPNILEHTTRKGAAAVCRAIDFFMLFFNMEVIEMLVENSNTYAWLHILDKQSYSRYNDGSWEEITVKEMIGFLSIIIYMGLDRLPEMHKYWTTIRPFIGTSVRQVMSRNRFKAILGFLHVVNPDEEDAADKLTKIRPLLEHFQKVCPALYQPARNISIDERMVKSKARSGICQFMPKKPVRFGFKLWCICDPRNGYTLLFNVYTGKREAPSPHGLAYDVVNALMPEYKHQGYFLWMDNFYTSPTLLTYLSGEGIGACGTVQVTRKGFPQSMKDKEWIKKAKRSDLRFVRADSVLCLQWMDTKVVSVCSTIHKGNDYSLVKRNLQDPKGTYRVAYVKKPLAIVDYNKWMGGVDLSDQLIEPYNVLLKSYRWWKTLFFHFIDVAIVNAFILFKEWQSLHPNEPALQRPPRYSQLAFREELVNQLVELHGSELSCTSATDCRSYDQMYHTQHVPEPITVRRNCKLCYIIEGKEQKTRWICGHPQCGIPLCLVPERNCMKLWHSPSFDAKRKIILETCRHK